MLGYYKDDERTRETFTEDGYLRTGDKGEIDELGRLRITGRIKEIFKTSKGKYVVPAPIENRMMGHPAIEMVCVSGADFPQPHALLMLSEEAEHKRSDESYRRDLEASLKQLLEEVNRSVDPHERLQFLVVVKEPWSIENNFLTPTLKLKRNIVEDTYKNQFQRWYDAGEPVIWL